MTMPVIRPIAIGDNQAIADIIRNSLVEFKANRPGTAYFDRSTDALFEFFQKPRCQYLVAESGGQILGGAGIYPTDHLPADTCELVKMYLLPEARNLGLGSRMIRQCLDFATSAAYKNVYLETMPELSKAVSVYERFGFTYLDGPMGQTEHFGCSIWMIKHL